MTQLAGYVDLHPEQRPARRLRELVGTAGSVPVEGDGWLVAGLPPSAPVAGLPARDPLPGDDAPVLVVAGAANRGLLVGRLFHLDGDLSRRSTEPVPLDWLDHDGALPRRRWGRYVGAAVRPDGTLLLVRDPIGHLPCFHVPYQGGLVFATRMALLVDLLGECPAPDWDRLGTFVVQGPGPTTRTAWQGVSQLPPGTRLRRTGRETSREPLWSAAAVAAGGGADPDPDALRETLRACTRAWVGSAPVVALDLSGGLDSSAVAWAVHADLRADQTFQPRYVSFPAGASLDERPLAGAVTQRLGSELLVVDGADLLPLTPPKGELPRADAPQLQFTEARLNELLAEQAGPAAEALGGGGGDQVFVLKGGGDHLADHLRRRGALGLVEAWRESRHGLTPFPQLLATAGRELRRGRRREPALTGHDFDFPRPAWLSPPDPGSPLDLPAGAAELSAVRAGQILGIAYWGDAVDREHRNPHRPSVYPLLSQPVVEFALRTSVPALVDHTGDRLPLRRAVRGLLPGSATDAAVKGSYAGMYQLALRHNAAVARELIMDGRCAEQGLVEREAALADLRATGRGFVRGPNWPLYNLLAVELWCRAWRP
ncbi:asparagine synthase-related protein [Polymorphospora rubra]|uniref:asparagine synthase (glutamine-hydrolyzing) n=1 Tax=Polymorphospora rubra TaxID=338584 RepID=A0A810N2N5_9ACTN|nr:asparagine synthase-related protein [Polymorphospora rubra]BCJ65795.1 hypothetical protein Prubr_28160 [Polymorphospora rubra]